MSEFDCTIAKARGGAIDAIGELLEPYRNYLRFLAVAQMGRHIGLRVNPSDLVQDAMLAAHRDFVDFRGETAAEFSNWLRTILARCLLKAIECHVTAEKRDVRREISIDRIQHALDSSSDIAARNLVSQQPTPSQIASRDEEFRLVADLISQLPADYQEVIALRNFSGLRFEEVASRMQRSSQAVRMLWLRAIHRLRDLLPADQSI